MDVARIRQASMSSPEPQVFLRSHVWKTTFHLQTCANERLLPMALGTRGIPPVSRLVQGRGRKSNVCGSLKKVWNQPSTPVPMPSVSTGSCGLQRESSGLSQFWWAWNVAITAVPVVCRLGSAPRTSSNTLLIMCSLGRRFRRAVGCLLFSCAATDESRVFFWCERRQILQHSSGFLAQVYPKFTPSGRSSQTSASSWSGLGGVSNQFSCFCRHLDSPLRLVSFPGFFSFILTFFFLFLLFRAFFLVPRLIFLLVHPLMLVLVFLTSQLSLPLVTPHSSTCSGLPRPCSSVCTTPLLLCRSCAVFPCLSDLIHLRVPLLPPYPFMRVSSTLFTLYQHFSLGRDLPILHLSPRSTSSPFILFITTRLHVLFIGACHLHFLFCCHRYHAFRHNLLTTYPPFLQEQTTQLR